MIKVPDSVKTAYKADNTKKSYFVVFRDSGIVLTNTEIVSESLSITESICSSGSFKIGLCEASICNFEAILPKNLNKDEMCVFQCLGDFNVTWDTDDTYGLYISGDDITNSYTGRNVDAETNLILGDSGENFLADKNYLILAKVKYIYKEIQLYLENSSELRRNIYYINPSIFNEKEAEEWDDSVTYNYGEIVIDDNSAWKSISSNNTDRPSANSAKWEDVSRYLQIALPIPGNDVTQYACALYSKYTDLIVAAKIYETDAFIMPLGLYGVDRCQKKNSSKQYGITGYNRMRDVNLSENTVVSYNALGTTIGSVLDSAVENTQIALGSNLSVEGSESSIVSSSAMPISDWPSNPIYESVLTKTITGTYNRNGSGYTHTGSTRFWTFNELKALGNAVTWRYQYTGSYYDYGLRTANIYYPEINGYRYNVDAWDGYKFHIEDFMGESRPSGSTISSQQIENWYNNYDDDYTPGFYKGLNAGYNPNFEPSLYINARNFEPTLAAFSLTETYTYGYSWDTSQVQGWKLVSEVETSEGHCTRTYSLKYTWNASVSGRKINYQVDDYQPSAQKIYNINYYYPSIYGAYPDEKQVYEQAQNTVNNIFTTNKQQIIENAIANFCTDGNIAISNNGEFEIQYIESLRIDMTRVGSDTITTNVLNGNYLSPFIEVALYSQSEKFSLYHIDFNKQNALQTARRNIISSYLELNGLFITFDRYGISQLKAATAATLYPAEDLFPRDADINPAYSNIYPSESGELVNTSVCKSLLVEDRLNEAFDGIEIIKSDSSASDASQYPFFYNRQSSEYGAVPVAVEETGYYEGQNYYVIKDNFFFDNFIFTNQELLEICRELIKRIGFLRYFNLNAELRALPYLEPGDAVLIMTADSGIETLVLRRTMSGCIAMMDSIETDFYDE
jgi:hypothetical protein